MVVVTEIINVAVEVVPAMVVDASPTEDVAVIIMLLTLLILKLVLLLLLKNMALPDVGLFNLLQVVVVDSGHTGYPSSGYKCTSSSHWRWQCNPPSGHWGRQGCGGPPTHPTYYVDKYYQGEGDPNQGYEEHYHTEGEEVLQ